MCCSVNIWTGPSCFTTVAYCAQTCRMFSWHFYNLTPVGLSTTCQYCISLLEPRTYLPWLKWVCNLQLTCYWHLPASNAAPHLHDLKYFSAYVHVRMTVPFSFTRPIILLKHGEHPLLIWAGRSTFMLCLLFSFLASYKTSHGLLLQCDPPPPSLLVLSSSISFRSKLASFSWHLSGSCVSTGMMPPCWWISVLRWSWQLFFSWRG